MAEPQDRQVMSSNPGTRTLLTKANDLHIIYCSLRSNAFLYIIFYLHFQIYLQTQGFQQ